MTHVRCTECRQRAVPLPSKSTSITLLVLAEIAGMSLWFASAAILPDMVRESGIDAVRQAMLSSGVQLGFVIGALSVAASGLADRFDPRRVFALCGVLAALCNARAADRADRRHDRHPAARADRRSCWPASIRSA